MKLFKLCMWAALIVVARSLNVLSVTERVQNSRPAESTPSSGQKSLRRILEGLANTKLYLTSGGRRAINPVELAKAKNIFDAITKSMAGRLKIEAPEQMLRGHQQGEPIPVGLIPEAINMEREELLEHELEGTRDKHSSALLTNAYVQKKGRNDFLVMEDDTNDKFITVVPNDIYYNIEKKCVNWLDDCSLQGIRARLLEKVRSPYRK